MNELALTTWLQRVRAWLELMEQRAIGNQLSWAAEQAWGDSHDVIPIIELEALTAEGDTSWVPAVMLSSAESTDTETTAFNPANQTIVANSDWAVTASMAEVEERLTSALADYLYQKTTSNSASSEQRENFAAAALDNSAQITTHIAEAGSLAEVIGQEPLKFKHLTYIGNDETTRTGRYGSTSDAAYVPWRNGDSKDNGYISKLTHSGELQWRKQIADVTNIITATDDDENVYTAWSRSKDYTPESRGSFIGKLNPVNGELLWTTKLDTHNYIIQDLHAVGETLYGVGSYKDTQRPVLLAVNRTDGKLLWLKEEPASDSEQFTDIQSDGTHLYISSTSRNKISGTIHKYTLDGDVADQWQGSDRPDLKRTGTQDRYSVIVGDQLISVGTTGAQMPHYDVQWRLVSRNLETGEINWRKQWGGLQVDKDVDGIIAFKGKIYILTRRGPASRWNNGLPGGGGRDTGSGVRNNGVIQEVSLDGELGRQLFYEIPEGRTASQLSSDGERLYLVSGKVVDKNSVAHLTTSENYQNDAYDEIGINQSFEVNGRAKDNYGSELSGYLTPKEDGEYVFYLSSDDHAELWLSSDDSKQNLQLITKRDHATYFRDYGHAHSESIQLKAGQRYAIKALHKEGIGASHLSVAWRPASEPAPAKGAEPIGSDYLSYDLGDNNNTDIEQSQGQGLVAKYYDNVKAGLSAAYQQIITGNETIDSTNQPSSTGNTAPTIELKGAQTIRINQHGEWVEPHWVASDADGDELNVSVTTPKPIDTSVPGTYEITYTVEDSGGLQNSATRTIEVLAPREGNDYYLALDGSDDNDGSIDQPFATFKHARNFLQAGDTLHLRGGWYYEQFYIDGRETPNLWKWNDRHNPVTIKAYEGETVVLSEAPPISTTWVKDGNRWKTNVWEGSDDLGNNKRNISRLFLDDKLLTGARYPNLEKDWDQPGHNWFHTRVQTIPNPEAGEGVSIVPGLEDVDGSIKGAAFYSYWRGAREVLEHEAGSANITTPPGADNGWLMGALPLLDADREWFFDKETGDLYLQLPAGMDPNEQTIRARTDLHGIGRMDGGLAVTNGGALVFDGINLFATPFTFNASRNITFKNAKLLHNDYHDLHLGGTYNGHGNFIWSSHGLRFINNEIAYNYRPAFNMGKRGDEWGGWWPTHILFENNYMHDGQIYASHNGGPLSWRTSEMTAVHNTLDNYGFGGLGRIAGGSHLELNYVNNANYAWDTAGIQMNQIIDSVNIQRNWIFNTKRNGIRSDGHPGGTGKIVTHNVVMGNGTGIKLKGDQHKVHHNLGFLNGADIGMWESKFYGYTRATDSTIQDLVEAEKYQKNAYDNIKVTEGFEIEGYGQSLWGGELSGFLTPKQDGNYVFYLAADDEAELWLSTDDNTENLAVIADRRQKSGYRMYTAGYDSETLDQPGRSLSISLKAGQRYAIKALVRDGVESYKNQRSNHLSVAWRFDNEAAPVDGAEPIANEYLSYDLGDDRNHTLPIRGDGLTAKYYHDLFDTYIPSRSNATESRLGSRTYGGPERQGNYLSVAHNNAINGGFDGHPIQDPEDRSNISTRGSRKTDIRDELRDVNNLDFRPKSGSSLIDSGIEIEGIHTPIAGITDGVVGSAADAGAYEYGDSHYWIAGHQTDKARFPIGATDQSTTAQPDLDLIWMEGLDSVSNLVYFGEDPEQLEFKVEQDGNIFDPTPEDGELLEAGKTYYWRIDTRTQDDTIIEGDTWSFTVDNRVKDVEIEAVLVDYQPDDYARAYRKNFGGVTKEELPAPKYDYYISKYEITNSQYAAFLNDTAGHNTNDGGAWHSSMQIKREASPSGLGGFIYTPIEGKENHPVTYITWNNAALFTNWLSGDAGAIYANLGSNKYYNSRYNGPSNASAWGHGAVSLPKLEEFYKASIYNRETNTLELYSTGGNSITLDQANFKGEDGAGVGETTEIGSYPYPSYFGTYDQTGNVAEWTDHRSHKLGGSYLSTTTDNTLGYRSDLSGSWGNRHSNIGFRVVSRTANERDKDNNGQSEFYITKFEDQDNRAPEFNNPTGNLDDVELEQTDQLLNSEDDTWRLKSATLYQPYSFSIKDSVIEPQGYNFWFQLLEGPEWLKLSEDGEFTGTPTEEEHLGRFNIRYRVESDSNLFSTTTEPIELVVEPVVNASTGDDVIQTTFGSSVVFALAGDDVVQGSEQDETFDGGRGDDTMDGGEGQDIAKYSGKKSDYSLKILESGAVEIKDLREIVVDPKEVPTVEQLKSSDKYQNNAFDEAKIVNQFEFQKYGDDYGAELSGYLTPKEDGYYIFYISADDHAELWLSTDAEKENLELIAKRNMFSHFRRYTHQSGDYSGRSHVVELKAGERYAIKALMTEAGGGDHLSVTWGLATNPAPSHGAEPIPAEFLSYDLGDEVIADIAQSQGEGLVIKYFKNLRERHNPDGVDQLINIEHLEFADGIQPIADAITLSNAEPISHEFVSSFGTSSNDDTSVYFKPSATQDLIILPWIDKININKNSVEELTKTEAYKNDDYSALVVREKLETYGRNKDNYGVEVTGYITPTQTGNYTFYLAADDHGELWLSSDNRQENLELIVRRDTATGFRDYSKARSESIQLQAGQRYAIKGLMKDDGGADNFSVAWAMEDEDAPANGAEPISGDVFSYDLGDSYVQADGEPPQTGQGLAFKYFDGLSTSGDRATIRAINFQGELAWEKQLSDASQITTATDSAGHIYAAWERHGAKPWMIGKFDANGDLLWEKELEQNNHTVRSMVVNGDTIYTAGYASQTGGPSGLIYSINAVDGSINWTETQSNPISELNDILTDGDALYVVGQAAGNPPNPWGDSHSHSHAYKYDFDGNQIWESKWHPKTTPNHVSRSRWAKEFSAIIFENQLISVGTAYVNTPDTNWLNYPVSRDLETGEILWHKQLRDVDNTWKSGLNHDIVSHNGFAYIISNNGSQTTIFEMEKDGSLGRQLTLDSTHANNFVVANNELHLFGRTSLNTSVAENQGGDDLFLAKIDSGFDNAVVPFSGISIIPTAPRDSEGNLQTSEDGSSTSFKVKLNQAPFTNEDVVVTLTGIDSTEGELSTNELTFNRSNWDLGQDVVVTGVADNTYDTDSLYTIHANASNSGGYQGSESDNISVINANLDEGIAPSFQSAATSTDGTRVLLTYSETLSATAPTTSAFSVTTGGSDNPITAVAISGSTVELTLTNAVKNDDSVTVAYSDPSGSNDSNAIQDPTGNDAASLNTTAVTNNSTVAGTAPSFQSAATSTDGTRILLSYSETLSATTAEPSAFSVTTGGSDNPITAVAISGSTIELTLTNAVKNDDSVTVAYSDPSGSNDSNAIQDSYGNIAASLSTTPVNNNSIVKNEPPSALILNNTVSSLPENSSTKSRIKLADIAITDDDLGTNLITLTGAAATNFEIKGTSLFLKAGTSLDFETQSNYFISLTVTDPTLPDTSPITADFFLEVEDLTELQYIQTIDKITPRKKVLTYKIHNSIQIESKSLENIIVGTKKKDKITGTSGGEILAGLKGKDVLRGGEGADGFLFNKSTRFGMKNADQIKDFDPEAGDSILLDNDLFGLGKKIKLKSYGSRNKVKKAAKSKNDFVYDDKKGLLYFNENGKQKGWGDGGLFTKLQGAPDLGADDFTIV